MIAMMMMMTMITTTIIIRITLECKSWSEKLKFTALLGHPKSSGGCDVILLFPLFLLDLAGPLT